ncbi:type II CAAX endopeptidase family protein [Dyella sp. A6]|uniref:CPBP family intramembrane glutamic endopeptidase n=1 Tax=Dyella aluminiiresistens TaxID=3069105 RepID=UPI002E759DC5|nr:type II CAAX endopeptidase family protein [Dyella sp. A6]
MSTGMPTSVAFVTPASAPAWKRWLLYSPLARMLIFAVLFVAGSMVMGVLLHLWLGMDKAMLAGKGTMTLKFALAQLLMRVPPALLAYLVLVKLVERRPMTELAPRRLVPDSLRGIAAGTLLLTAIVGVLWLLGSYHVVGFNPHAAWLPALLMVGISAGISEELIFRGALFRIVEEGQGTWVALLVSALFFGFAHTFNPGATAWSSMAIAIEAGVLFGLVYHVTRSLAVCMGLHAAWNFCEGTLYGSPVSGLKANGWLVSTRTGPDWLSGGVFGIEASVVALALCIACSIALLLLALRRHSIVAPAWRRR